MPDQDKSFMPDGSGASGWHYLDADSRGYDPLPYQGQYDGDLPWAMKLILDNIVYYLKNGDNVWAAKLMGAICHFAADASCPLHATEDYNPGGSGHSAYEGAVNGHIGEISVPGGYVPQYLEDITNAALVVLAGSFDFTDEDPTGGVNVSDYLEVGISWNSEIKSMTENRIRAGVQFTANVWYTAMVEAGLVSGPATSSVHAITPYWENSIPFTITATAGANARSVSLYYSYSVDGSSWGENTLFENDDSEPYSWSFTAPQGDGYYEFYSIARDSADNLESPPAVADATCAVDSVAPSSSLSVISPYWCTSVPFDITATVFDATSGVKNALLYYRHSSDNTNWGNWTSYGACPSPWKWSFTAPFGSGCYEFYSIAMDWVNHVEQAPTAADARCGVDNVSPGAPAKISPSNGAKEENNTPTFKWFATTDSMSGIAKYELWVDDSPDFSSPEILENTAESLTTSYTPTTALANGNYSWRVRAWDQVGNPGPFESTWTFLINVTQSPVRRGLEVLITPLSKSGENGATLTYTVTVSNTGNVTEDYNISKTDTLGWTLTLTSSVVNVAPGEDRQVTLTVGIPATAEENTLDNITITVTSTDDPAMKDSASCAASCIKNVLSVTSLTISPSRFALYPGYSGAVQSLTATLRDINYNPLSNKTITWLVASGSIDPSSGTTDPLGQVSVVYTAPTVTAETPQVTITASFAGDTQYQASSGISLGIPATPVSVNIPAENGGTVSITVVEINVTVNILAVLPNALSENTAIEVVQKLPENLPAYVMVSNIFDIGPNGTNFNTPSTLTLPYNENGIPLGMSENNLAIYRRIGGGDSWELVGGNVDEATNTISVQINHLSEYAIMASIGGSAVESGGGGLPLLPIVAVIVVIVIIAIIAVFIRRR